MKIRMRTLRERFPAALPFLLLVVFVGGIGISAFHDHSNCEGQQNCVICSFHTVSYLTNHDDASEPTPLDVSFLQETFTYAERIPTPFHTCVFASHAPPRMA